MYSVLLESAHHHIFHNHRTIGSIYMRGRLRSTCARPGTNQAELFLPAAVEAAEFFDTYVLAHAYTDRQSTL